MPVMVRSISITVALVAALTAAPMSVRAQSHILPAFKACLANVQATGGGEYARSQCYWEHWSQQASGR